MFKGLKGGRHRYQGAEKGLVKAWDLLLQAMDLIKDFKQENVMINLVFQVPGPSMTRPSNLHV